MINVQHLVDTLKNKDYVIECNLLEDVDNPNNCLLTIQTPTNFIETNGGRYRMECHIQKQPDNTYKIMSSLLMEKDTISNIRATEQIVPSFTVPTMITASMAIMCRIINYATVLAYTKINDKACKSVEEFQQHIIHRRWDESDSLQDILDFANFFTLFLSNEDYKKEHPYNEYARRIAKLIGQHEPLPHEKDEDV